MIATQQSCIVYGLPVRKMFNNVAILIFDDNEFWINVPEHLVLNIFPRFLVVVADYIFCMAFSYVEFLHIFILYVAVQAWDIYWHLPQYFLLPKAKLAIRCELGFC